MTIPSKLTEATQADVERLVSAKVQEGPHIDFKRDLPTAWDNAAKSEFLADVSSFANAGGGDVIYGVAEDESATASAVVPQVPASIDQEVLRMQDLLLNQVEPRMPGVQVFPLPVTIGTVSGYVVVVRVPQSWAGPHRVRLGQHFYIREGQRKRQLDVPELRGMFVRSDTQAQRVRDFRTERLGKILSGDTPQRLVDGPVLVAHLIPVQSALGLVQIDAVQYSDQRYVPVLGTSSGWARMNIDGALAVRNLDQGGFTHGYSQLFRSGFLEATKTYPRRGAEERVNFPSARYEEDVIALLRAFRVELQHHGVEPSCTVMLSLIRADEMRLGVGNSWFLDEHQTLFDRATIVIPDVLTAADIEPAVALRPAFDMVWQAAGFTHSGNYDASGVWTGQR